ncbi:glycosyltransferase family 4 protein [uncultured Methanoculleus sp.]|jgi:glycosyltransferase involved in cell wall biosynthesis|uniref:glycosyltransferase family 4 protein n=1 Tax=uncultured Methanoculleus sp. TaxID=183762 RepID=UPI003204ED9B
MDSKSIGIVTFPINKNGVIPLSNLVDITSCLCPKPYLITGSEGYNHFQNDQSLTVYNIAHTDSHSILKRILKYLIIQLQIGKIIITSRHDVSTWIFFIGGSGQIIPLIIAKIVGKKTYLLLAGSEKKGADIVYHHLAFPVKLLINVGYFIVDKIVIYSVSLIRTWDLAMYQGKIFIAHEHYFDLNFFTITAPLADRPPLIGYIGSLGEVKGVQNFIQALPEILSNQPDLRAFVGGDGQLKEAITTALHERGVTTRVDLPGWISHDTLPKYLNQLRLIVLPSYSEGLPNIMLEAMACGTPVLATPVGAIPDIIIDGKTGFIMENNSPECIAKNVIRALSSPDLEQIAENGRRFVEENFTFEKTVENWRRILQDIE